MEVVNLPQWKALEQHASLMQCLHMRDFFAEDKARAKRYSLEVEGIFLDYSKNIIRRDTLDKLLALAQACGVEPLRDAMFAGEKINTTENRAVLHTALRNRSGKPVYEDGEDVMPAITAVLAQMQRFSTKVREGKHTGYSGKAITDVVNIGIGGSDLGPKMVCKALANHEAQPLKVRFLSNVDGVHFDRVIHGLNPETTLFVVTSKTFTTQETLLNARSAKQWFVTQGGAPDMFSQHVVAVTENITAAQEFGVVPEHIFAFWDWVGGRYSLWSAVGLSIMLAIGYEDFIALLEGGYAMDRHFRHAPLQENMPVLLAMLSVWYNNFFDCESHAILPYNEQLRFFPPYLEQLEMESNGKSVDKEGKRLSQDTGTIVWGAQGINGQHAFYQLLHQSSRLIPTDFIVSLHSESLRLEHHEVLVANFIAQTEALMKGRTAEETLQAMREAGVQESLCQTRFPHMLFAGNKPSNSLVLERLTPHTLGALLALYEHKVFVQGVVWNLNSYDQWGVELGKKMGVQVLDDLRDNTRVLKHDSSTNQLIERFRHLRK